jgi:uncharacterized short protein YbdD (DUF466 family)
MNSSYQNYLSHFKKFSPDTVRAIITFTGLSDYSTYINNKANEIISNASADNSVDCSQLQHEIFQLGVDYVKIFATMRKAEKVVITDCPTKA